MRRLDICMEWGRAARCTWPSALRASRGLPDKPRNDEFLVAVPRLNPCLCRAYAPGMKNGPHKMWECGCEHGIVCFARKVAWGARLMAAEHKGQASAVSDSRKQAEE